MDRREWIELGERIVRAPDIRTRMRALVDTIPDDALDGVGLRHPYGFGTTALVVTGALAIGAAVGAGIALLVAPSTGHAMQKRIGRAVDRARKNVERSMQAAGMRSTRSEAEPPRENGHSRRPAAHA